MADSAATYFKIRRKSDGMFSTGGARPKFDTKGHVWRRRADVMNHLGLRAIGYRYGYGIHSALIGELELVSCLLVENKAEDLKEVMKGLEQRRQQRVERREVSIRKAKLRNLEREAARLKKEIGKSR